MAETLPAAVAAVGQILNGDSAARLSNEAKATMQNEQKGLTINKLTLNFQSCGKLSLFHVARVFSRRLCCSILRLWITNAFMISNRPVPKSWCMMS